MEIADQPIVMANRPQRARQPRPSTNAMPQRPGTHDEQPAEPPPVERQPGSPNLHKKRVLSGTLAASLQKQLMSVKSRGRQKDH